MNKPRLSSWVIRKDISDQEEVWLHGYTGAVDVVDKNEIEEPSDEVRSLMLEKGYLTFLSEGDEKEKFIRIVQEVGDIESAGNIYVVQFSVACNFACTYCFENKARKNSVFKNMRITPEYFTNIERTITELKNEKKDKLILFGGEPLLEENRESLEKALEMKFNLGISSVEVITNGYNIDLFAELLTNKDIVFQITLDGIQEVHEKRRIKKRTGCSYEKIINNVRMLLERGQRVELRVNVDADNYQSIPLLFEEFCDNSLADFDEFFPYLAYTLDYKDYKDGLSPKELYKYFYSQEVISRFNIGRDPLGLEMMIKESISGNKPFSYTSTNCGGNKGNMFVFAPDGRVHACWDCGPEDQEIGSYQPDRIWNKEFYKQNWLSRKVENLPVCKECKYALFCGGGCQYLAEKRTGSYFSPYCNGFQDLFDEVLLKTSMSLTGE